MEVRFEPLRESFSTADAESVRLAADSGRLRVTFRDWRERPVALVFHDVVAFSWDDGDAAVDPGQRDDCCYVIHDSPWLVRHRETGTLSPGEGHRHFKLCFNAAGVLQVLAAKLEVVPDPGEGR